MTDQENDGAPQRHILLKLSGEVLGGVDGAGLDESALCLFVDGVERILQAGLGVALVIGGGNIFRGIQGVERGVERVTGDYMGMMATIINALALKDQFARRSIVAEVFTPFYLPAFSTQIRVDAVRRIIGVGGVAIFGGGTGSPFFSTDTAAALRAAETGAYLFAKGTKVDGVYDKDPKVHANARRYARLSYDEVLERNLKVMDGAAVAICRDAGVPMLVFDSSKLDNFSAVAAARWEIGTLIGPEPEAEHVGKA